METIDRKFKLLAVNPISHKIYDSTNALLLCAKDKAVPVALKAYRKECKRIGSNSEHLVSIGLLIERVEYFQKMVISKIPDTIGDEIRRCIDGIGV